ncbi:MAG: hypothetical protein HC849_32865 [Oscillatoriales cyanobacterium RU_3_3]|nr:hypothetical protein [Oscillatoriales cyanobacterium RU_3_3]
MSPFGVNYLLTPSILIARDRIALPIVVPIARSGCADRPHGSVDRPLNEYTSRRSNCF